MCSPKATTSSRPRATTISRPRRCTPSSLEKSPKTAKDLECPHGVQFYDVVIDGERHARNAWVYEAPQPKLAHVGGRFGFWQDVEVD